MTQEEYKVRHTLDSPLYEVSNERPVIGWFSGGITSAIACKLCVDWFGKENVRIVFIDTKSEDKDTYRFKHQCESWYGIKIETITNSKYKNVEEVWFKYLSLNVAHGAICSTEMKRAVREAFQKENNFSFQAFGFEFTKKEMNRAKALQLNHPDSNPIFPLLSLLIDKQKCFKMLPKWILPPTSYLEGFGNNNCLERGCVQGGIGYWQKMQREKPDKFDHMALVEHQLTDLKGKPVTMLKDQGKDGGLVFLKPHPLYPDIKDISMMTGREPKPLVDCNGFCGTNDLAEKNDTESEINYQ